MIKKQKIFFILLLSLLPRIIFSQGFDAWETLYKESQLTVEVQFKIEPGSCLNSVKNKIQYRLNGKLSSLDYYLIWTTDYKDCSGNIFFQEHSLNISSGNALANGSDIALGDTWHSIEDEFFSDKVLVKFYNVRSSSAPSNLSGIKEATKTEKKLEYTNKKADKLNGNVTWYTFPQAVALQKKAPRPIMVDIYTNWCGPCKMMSTNTFGNEILAKYINDHFYPVKFNAETRDTVSFSGVTFANKNPEGTKRPVHDFAISILDGKLKYPSIVFLNEDIKKIQIFTGYYKADQFEPILKFFGSGLYKNTSWEDFQKTFVPEI